MNARGSRMWMVGAGAMNGGARAAGLNVCGLGLRALASMVVVAASAVAHAQSMPQVSAAWVRGTVSGQSATGAFLAIESSEPVSLVGARSPIAASVQVHEMAMDGAVMKMRPVAAVKVEPGRRLELKPGGYHIMMTGVRSTLRGGERVPLSLDFEGADGRRITVETQADVRDLGAAAPAAPANGGHMRH